MSDSSPNSFSINSLSGTYVVEILGTNVLRPEPNSVAIIDDNELVRSSDLVGVFERKILVEAAEEKKTLATCIYLLEELARMGCRKDVTLYAVGGGVVQDLVTLAASIYMRGVAWTYIPTTLVSALDSCVGGKSSINLGTFKNIVGNFYPPKRILIDVNFTKTLTDVDLASGIAEGMKICFAKGKHEFARFRESIKLWRETGEIEYLTNSIVTSLLAKKWFIEIDEFDRKERKLLNFGHSFAHALEAASSFAIPHGLAVLVGMRAAILESGSQAHCTDLLNFIDQEIWLSGLSTEGVTLKKDIFLEALKSDKKNSNQIQVLILPNSDGLLEVCQRELSPWNLESCLNSLIEALEYVGVPIEVF